MNEAEITPAETVIAEIDATLVKLNDAHGFGGWLGDDARIRKMAETLESGAHKLVVRHVWNRLLIHAVMGNALPAVPAQTKSEDQAINEVIEPIRTANFKNHVGALVELWKARDYIRASIELNKAMQEYQESTIALNHYSFLIQLLRNWITPEQFRRYEEQLTKFSKDADSYKRLPPIIRAFRKPPTPPEEPGD